MSDKPLSNTQKAVQAIRSLIFSGELAAGSNHLEVELAERFGMSRTPVREAALILEGQGLLELRQRKGVRILPVSVADMGEIYDVLTELESLAAEQAAKQGYSAKDLAALEAAINDMDAAIDAGDLHGWADADDRFHAELVRLGRNSRVSAIVAMMSDQVRRVRLMTLFMRPVPQKSNKDHRNVLEAIANGDFEAARSIHKTHRQQAKQMLIGLLQKMNLNQV
ncbi:GntR family transcriptional regulator [Abyssibius alkaniclasticus]|uniref:GntR family transcriptional regulator n=1 Tax=Abyssibius alkaniclasticus TaxID=2881234 RepID=UPI002363F2BD|nr:GntR family transcriptional regulator [Abyssibius alkaniclasticus]UPH70314.1 GntR family transcriptional regulator [Abyssibius alkaniclasticus]